MTSYDRTLVVKEISSEEVEEMHNILSEYHQVGPRGGKSVRNQSIWSMKVPFFVIVWEITLVTIETSVARVLFSALHWIEVHLYFIHDLLQIDAT